MKRKSYIKAILSSIFWGLGQLLNRQYLKALFFFVVFALFIGIELGTSNYFYNENYEGEIAYNKIPGKDLGNSWFENMPTRYYQYLAAAAPNQVSKVKNENFENYLDNLGVTFTEINGTKIPTDNTNKLFTEEEALKFFAEEFQAVSPEKYTNLMTNTVVNKESVNVDYLINVRENLYYDEVNGKVYYQNVFEDENKVTIREYVETNILLNRGVHKIANPEILDTNQHLVRFVKMNEIFKYNNELYLKVSVGESATAETKYIKINKENQIVYYTDNVSLLSKIDITGELYFIGDDIIERYNAGQIHNGRVIQYNQSTIMYTFRRMMDQTFRTPGNSYTSTDVEKFMLKVYFEINTDLRDEYTNYYSNFFNDRAGIFLKGYWSVVTLGKAKKQNYTSYMALKNNIVGATGAEHNINEHVSLVESIPIQGHVSTMLLIEGLIAVILSFFFFIFGVWSAIDAYRVSEKRREGEEVENTKEYFKSVWDNGFEYIVLSPALFVLGFISIMPILFGFIIAFTSISGNQSMVDNFDYVGLKNFVALFNFKSGLGESFGKAFWSVLWWTIIWAILSTFTVFFGGFIQALILNSEKVIFRKLWRTILILPWAIPALLSQMVFSVMFKETGFINQFLLDIGLYDILKNIGILGKPFNQMSGFLKYFWLGNDNIQWFNNSFNIPFVRATLVVVNIWLGFPYFMALMTGIMTAIDKTLYEAADIDGATGMQKTMRITVPLVLYSTAPILIMTFSGNFNNFGVIYFITGGGPNTGLASRGYAGSTDILISWMYSLTVDYSIYNMASVFSVLVFLVVGSVTAWNLSKTRAFQGD